MKHLILLATILITSIATAQNGIERKLGYFNQLKVYDLIEVQLIKSNQNKVIITGENYKNVVINNKNGTLKIKMNIKETFDGNNTKIILYYTNLDIIDANEGSKIWGKDTITQFEINLKAQEGAKIDVILDVKAATIKSVTGGNITTTGTAVSQKASVFTGGVYNAEQLKTTQTTVTINAGGEAIVNASKLVDAKIKAGGNIFIYGNPETINETTVLGGRIKRM